MKGDFSRIRFEPAKHYTDVLDQQGRVAFDADPNEQRFIDRHRRTIETIDVIGEDGAPMHDPGFAIGLAGMDLTIGAGRYYVHGLLCENPEALRYDEQPFLIESGDKTDIRYLLREMLQYPNSCLRMCLEVWQRMVTSLDDGCLGEPALGQADTTVRMQTVWRVVARLFTPDQMQLKKFLAGEPDTVCSCDAMYADVPPAHTGKLCAQVAENTGDCGCQPIPAAGYTGQENQLYRFEIQRGGTLATSTFKWSRENASIVVSILNVSGNKVSVNSLGMDANLGFQEGQWVEISDDTFLFGDVPNKPGELYQIQSIDRTSKILTMTTTVQPVDVNRNGRLRRWDQTGPGASADGIAISDSWIDIENGIQVRFADGDFFAGDSWTVVARSATGQIEWPPCGSDGSACQPPHYTHVYCAPLACIHRRERDTATTHESNELYQIDDCRRLFPSLTDLGKFVTAKALHITRINWQNDDAMSFDALVRRGLIAAFDEPPTGPLSPANFIVTLEVPTVQWVQRLVENPAGSGSAPTSSDTIELYIRVPTVACTEIILDSTVTRLGNTVRWTLPTKDTNELQTLTLERINSLLIPAAQRGTPARVRVKLPGKVLYAATDAGQQLYLDGQAFGQTAAKTGWNRNRIDLRFPTGDADRASDFESWFYLYPAQAVQDVSFTYQAVVVEDANAVTTIVSTTPESKPPSVQRASIDLSYAALAATTIQLSMTGGSGIATVPAEVAVEADASNVTVDVSIIGVPPNGTTETLTLTASLPSAIGQASSQTATFTVTGRPGGVIVNKAVDEQAAPKRKRST